VFSFFKVRRYKCDGSWIQNHAVSCINAHYIQARLHAHNTCNEKGEKLITGTKAAIEQIELGLGLAKTSQRYSFLLYNGSVHFWHVARPLMRPGTWHLLHPHLSSLLPVVLGLAGHDKWKVQLAVALAMCLGEVCIQPLSCQEPTNSHQAPLSTWVNRPTSFMQAPVYEKLYVYMQCLCNLVSW
jgi:hypothetical protein